MNYEESLLSCLFRLLTPNEINELTTTSGGKKKVPLSLIGQGFIDGVDYEEVMNQANSKKSEVVHEAKILDFNSKAENSGALEHENSEALEQEASVLECGSDVSSLLAYFSEQCRNWDKNVLGESRPKLNLNAIKKKETSTFIIEEKKKLEASTSKLKGVEVLDLYRKNSKVDIELQRNNKEDLSKASQSGVLVNKKHA
ncbi:MAG: hypothetical protein GY909_11250 [Oligoflexia bacterium]|nr:hypothetical protein [Oligoflexia bacterium]